MKKQAFLIMYHNDYYLLKHLLRQIDNDKFDIYLHVDKKVVDFPFEDTKKIVKNSNIYYIKRMNVKWSTSSMIKCEIELLKNASKGKYSYYHLISGVDMLLKSPDIIYDYFNKNKGYEFVGFQDINNITDEQLTRVKYYHVLNSNRRHKNKIIRKLSAKIYYNLLSIQKKIKINRLKKVKLDFRKGCNWFSITDDLCNYILTKEHEILRMYKYTNCCDEVFLQTLVYNSKFKNKIFNEYSSEHMNVKRCIDWNRGDPYTYTLNDYNELINSDCFFARKFSSIKDKEIIDMIFNNFNK